MLDTLGFSLAETLGAPQILVRQLDTHTEGTKSHNLLSRCN